MSFSHLLILGIIAVIVIPADKLPEVARQVARFIGEMRRMTTGVFDDLKEQVVLKPEDMMKQKQSNTIQPPELGSPTAPIENPEISAEEKKSADEEYLKHIQGERPTNTEVSIASEVAVSGEAAAVPSEKKTT